MTDIALPIQDEVVRGLHVGDSVSLTGVILTGRDAAHKWMVDTFIKNARQPQGDDHQVYQAIKPLLAGGAIYHCGPVVSGLDTRQYHFVSAGPTTSIREEPYQADVIHHFNLKAVIGKGGMGQQTLQACHDQPAVYLHAVGGAATLIAQSVVSVKAVYKLDFGVPEAIWVIDVRAFPAVVTMDAHGHSLHSEVEARSSKVLESLLAR